MTRACSFVGGSYFSLLLLALEVATIALSIGIFIVYGPSSVPDPRPASTSPWVWVAPANATHVAITVRLFGGSDSLFICKSPSCSSASAFQTISIPATTDATGLFKTIVGGLLQGSRYYYQVPIYYYIIRCPQPAAAARSILYNRTFRRWALGLPARSSRLLLRGQTLNLPPLPAPPLTKIRS